MSASPEQIQKMREAMRSSYDDLIDFAQTGGFQRIVMDLFSLPRSKRPLFVKRVILSEGERIARGIVAPDGILFQRSSFGDRRPTLFCIKKFLPKELWLPWQNVNVTIDDVYDDDEVPRDKAAWRPALHFDQHAKMIASGLSAKEIVAY